MRLFLLIAVAGLCPFGFVPVAAAAEDEPLDIESILDSPLEAGDYRRSVRCISTHSYKRVEILDDANVLFSGRGQTWLNQLRNRCFGLKPKMVLVMSMHGSRVCVLDRFHGSGRSGFSMGSQACAFGEFEAIDEVQVEGLRHAIEARRQTKTVQQPAVASEEGESK